MTGPELRSRGDGCFAIVGPMEFRTVGGLLEASRGMFAAERSMTLELGEVTKVDSAALALLLEWLRLARAEKRSIRFAGVPAKLLAIARLSGVEEMLADRELVQKDAGS